MKIAFMFSGQGSQYLGMCEELYANHECVREVFKQADEVLGYSIEEVMFRNEEKLNHTKYTQVAMFVMYQAILKILEKNNIESDLSFGLSLGEYGALLHNNVFDFETGLKIIQKRADLMEAAASEKSGRMTAILGMETEKLEDLLKEINGYAIIANYNTYGQLVISGESDAILAANKLASEYGARRVVPLKTSGAFHTKLMKSAEIGFQEFLKDVELKEPDKKLLVNVTGDYYHGNLKELMSTQITSSVRFYQIIEKAIEDGFDTFIEIGPKKTLCSFVKKIERYVNIFNVENEISLQNLLRGLEN